MYIYMHVGLRLIDSDVALLALQWKRNETKRAPVKRCVRQLQPYIDIKRGFVDRWEGRGGAFTHRYVILNVHTAAV